MTDRSRTIKPPAISAGEWRGEIVGRPGLNIGQLVQDGPPRQVTEFTHLMLSVMLTGPGYRSARPGILIIFAPTTTEGVQPDAGLILSSQEVPVLNLSLYLNRAQFSDVIRLLEANRIRQLVFTVEEEKEGKWPIRSWNMPVSF